jgi:hypothetical protein
MADIDQFILNNTKPEDRFVECYTVIGNHEFIDDENHPRINDENKALAKSVQIGQKPAKYYIKIGTYGKIYNPIGLYSEGHSEKFLSKIGRKQFEYKEVNQKTFNMYLNFLGTKNLAWLNNAERELS